MNAFSPAVITSRRARQDYQGIVGNYADLMKDMATHQQKVRMYQEQQAAQTSQNTMMKNDMDKARMTAGSQDYKTSLDFAAKTADTAAKQAIDSI